jgi:hypothetical protein
MATIGGQFISVPVFNQLVPDEGPKAIAISANFNGIDAYEVNLLQQKELGRIQAVQSIWFDNSRQDQAVIMTCDDTQQTIVFAGRTQGYMPVLVNQDISFTLSCSGGSGVFKADLLNVPMYPFTQSATI